MATERQTNGLQFIAGTLVRRAAGCVTAGNRSAKMCRSQAALRQRKQRTVRE